MELPEWFVNLFWEKTTIYQLLQSDPQMIKEIVDAVTIPVMAKVRIGHFVEAQVNYALVVIYENQI